MTALALVQIKDEAQEDIVRLLEEALTQARAGRYQALGIFWRSHDGQYGTTHSTSANRLLDAAMMIELALRRIGFASVDHG